MKPYRFSPLAQNQGLSIAAGAVNGLNQGVQQLARLRMQQMQMKAQQQWRMAQAQAMQTWRNSQAQLNEQRAAQVNTGKVHAAYLTDKYGITDGMTDKMIQQNMKNATPSDVNAMIGWAHAQGRAGQSIRPDLNVNEYNLLKNENSSGARQYQADQMLQGRAYTADQGLAGHMYTADQARAGKLGAAQISANARPGGGSTDAIELRASTAKLKMYQASLDTLNKPLPPGSMVDPDAHKAALDRAQQRLDAEDANYNNIISRMHGSPQGSGGAPAPGAGTGNPPPAQGAGAVSAPKYLTQDRAAMAQPNDRITVPGGYYRVSGKDANGAPHVDYENGIPKLYPPDQQMIQSQQNPVLPTVNPMGGPTTNPSGIQVPGPVGLPPVPAAAQPQGLLSPGGQ